MRKSSKVSNIFLFIASLSGALWTGSYLLRTFISYWFFEPEDFVLKAFITTENMAGITYSLTPVVSTTLILYLVFITTFILYIITTDLKLKLNGWLFISLLIVLVTLPFEAYLMTIDYKMISFLTSATYDPEMIIDLIRKRFNVLGNFPIVILFCYFSLFYFIIFRPFTKKINED
ncbi:MAG: hypothetical protein IPM56_08385 [Ignavibacteriales bacterium]|nr:MAG: hypothetical protein IPM56_08385 [Ignavibacteriales bacterium]